jgi:hypothetical protein
MEDPMRTLTTCAALVGLAALAMPALADDHATTGSDRSGMAVTAQTLRQTIDGLGYDVLRLKPEHGRFEAHIVDRASGGRVEAVFSARTGELIRARPES